MLHNSINFNKFTNEQLKSFAEAQAKQYINSTKLSLITPSYELAQPEDIFTPEGGRQPKVIQQVLDDQENSIKK